jgi:hypothetical protein
MERQYPLSKATLRDRTVGMVGMGRIGRAIARRLDGFGVPVVYHSRSPQAGVTYKHYPKLIDMARDVDTLILITPGGPSTRHLVNAEGARRAGAPRYRHQHVARHRVDDAALIKALKERKIYAAGLDVFVNEPEVPKEYLESGQCHAVPPSRLVDGPHPPEDGTARGRQPAGLGGGQSPVDAGARDTLAAAEAGVIICRHGPSRRARHSFCLTRCRAARRAGAGRQRPEW